MNPFGIGGAAVVAAAVAIHWWRAASAKSAIHRDNKLIGVAALGEKGDDAVHEELSKQGWRSATAPERLRYLVKLEGQIQENRQRIASHIEMMPQWGLLGTVAALCWQLVVSKGASPGTGELGLALVTTLIGLIGSIVCRMSVELQIEKDYQHAVRILQTPDLVKRLAVTRDDSP